MNSTIEKFLNNYVKECGGLRQYSPEKIMAKLEKEIDQLQTWLIDNRLEDAPELWRQKREAMLLKIKNLAEIKEENKREGHDVPQTVQP